MDDGLPPDSTQTVQAVLDRWPGAAQVFFDLRTACVGCPMARFCTLDEVVANYGLNRDRLMKALRAKRMQRSTLNPEGACK